MTSTSFLETLARRISALRCQSLTGQYFVPKLSLREHLTSQVISQAVVELDCPPEDRIGLAEAIERSLLLTFSVLLWIRNAAAIVKFWRSGHLDEKLPISEVEAKLIIPDSGTLFFQEQYQFKPHFFVLYGDYEIKQAVILPFIREIGTIDSGGFGEIAKVEIHPLSQNFVSRPVRKQFDLDTHRSGISCVYRTALS